MIHKVCEVAFERAADVAEWILDSGLPAIEDIDWAEIQSDRRRVKNKPTAEGLANLDIHARVIRNIDPRLARTQHDEVKSTSGSDYLHTLKDVCIFVGIDPSEENRRRLTRLSKMHHGPLHSPGQGKKKTIFEKVVVQKWFEDLQGKEAALAERRTEQQAQQKAIAATAFDITSRKAHMSGHKEEHVHSDHLSTDRHLKRKRK